MVAGGIGRSVAAGDGIMIPTPEKRSTKIKGDVPAEMVPSQTPLWCARTIIDFRPVDHIARTSDVALTTIAKVRSNRTQKTTASLWHPHWAAWPLLSLSHGGPLPL
jgi:hypothetical protein